MEAAKRKTFWLVWIASAILLSLPALASSVDILHAKTRAELQPENGQFSVEWQSINPVNATRYYDWLGEVASDSPVAPRSVKTPYGPAVQEQSAAALRVRSQIEQGGTVYKGGVLGRSETGASQFLATESPLNPGYAGRYGIPPQNAQFDFIMGGRVRPGATVITRSAPGIPPNPGGGIEGVINSGDFMIDWFHMP